MPHPDPIDSAPETCDPQPGPWPAFEGHHARIEGLMKRLTRLRRRLHAPGCTASQGEAVQERIAWLHGAIFAISSEIDCGY